MVFSQSSALSTISTTFEGTLQSLIEVDDQCTQLAENSMGIAQARHEWRALVSK